MKETDAQDRLPTVDKMDLPAIQIGHRGRFVSIARTKDELTTCASGALKSDYFTPPHLIVDADLTRDAASSFSEIVDAVEQEES